MHANADAVRNANASGNACALVGGIFIVPMLVLGLTGYWAWRQDVEQAKLQTLRGAEIVGERVDNAIETQALALEWVLDRTRGMTWDEIERSPEVHDLLRDVDYRYDASSEVYMIDAAGALRSDSTQFPLTGLQPKAPFRPIKAATTPGSVLVSAPTQGLLAREPSFAIAKARGENDGYAIIALRIDYFAKTLKNAAFDRFTIVQLHQTDGTLLARFPQDGEAPRYTPDFWSTAGSREVTFALESPALLDSQATHVGGVFASRRFPLVLTYSINRSMLFDLWLSEFFTYGLVALISSLTLSALAFYALKLANGEREALAAWNAEITHRLAAERTASQLKKFEALGTMSGGIVHYFNNLLPALVGHLEIAKLESEKDKHSTARMQRLIGALNEARDFLRGISTFSGRNVASFSPVCLSLVVQRAIETMIPLFPANTRLVSDIEPDVRVLGDESQLTDLVMNLIRNSIDAIAGASGVVEITLAAGDPASDDPYCRFECRDNGRGMSAEVAERAFDPFFTTRKDASGGLGLAICAGVVNAHASRIEMHTNPGEGTRMSVIMPMISKENR